MRRAAAIRPDDLIRDTLAPFETAPDPADERAWALILSAARPTRNGGGAAPSGISLRLEPTGAVITTQPGDASRCHLTWHPEHGWQPGLTLGDPAALTLFDLYLPLCGPGLDRPQVVAHLGQSLDGFIATADGDSDQVTGAANIRHLHRMRALCDAILVGAETVASDDPRLTTRLVRGPSPVRVVLDPRRRLGTEHRVFRDGAAETLWCCDVRQMRPGERRRGCAELLGVPCGAGGFDLDALLDLLAERGLRRIFVEGGGATVSRFIEAGRVDRLQVAIAPLLIGDGRPGLRLPPVCRMADVARPPVRVYAMGRDLLYDFDLGGAASQAPRELRAMPELTRIY